MIGLENLRMIIEDSHDGDPHFMFYHHCDLKYKEKYFSLSSQSQIQTQRNVLSMSILKYQARLMASVTAATLNLIVIVTLNKVRHDT